MCRPWGLISFPSRELGVEEVGTPFTSWIQDYRTTGRSYRGPNTGSGQEIRSPGSERRRRSITLSSMVRSDIL